MHQTMCNVLTRYQLLHLCILCAPLLVVAYNTAKVQNIRCIASSQRSFLVGYGSMEWNMEENFSMEYGMEDF